MTLKQHRRAAGGNGQATRDNKKLEPQLPADHPSEDTRYPKKSDLRLARRVLRVIETSGLLPELEKRLRRHPGRQSRLTIKTLLLCMILSAEETDRYLRSDICSIINGLDHRLGVELGLWTWDTRLPISYTTVVKQVLRLEAALLQTWVANNDAVRSINWFMHTFLSATLPGVLITEITAIALDWTPIKTWAVTQDFSIEEEVRKHKSPKEHPKIGELDLRWRLRRSACEDARGGWLTATSSTPAGPFNGFYGHAVTLAAPGHWSGNPNKIRIGAAPLMFSPFVKSVPANNDIAETGLNAVLSTLENFPNVNDVIADKGYTRFGKDFVRPLHELGLNVVMDYDKDHQKTMQLVTVGRGDNQQKLRLHCGTFFPTWLPKHWWVPPEHLIGEKRQEWYVERAKYRYSPISKPAKNGAIRFICPQCAGRVTTNAKTRSRRKAARKRTAPRVANIDQEHCCEGTITIPVEQLDTYQQIPFGTPAWHKRYTRRMQIENLNNLLKNTGGLRHGWCRALGVIANNMGLLALAVAHNLRQGKRYLSRKRSVENNGDQPPHQDNGTTPPSKPVVTNGTSPRGPPAAAPTTS